MKTRAWEGKVLGEAAHLSRSPWVSLWAERTGVVATEARLSFTILLGEGKSLHHRKSFTESPDPIQTYPYLSLLQSLPIYLWLPKICNNLPRCIQRMISILKTHSLLTPQNNRWEWIVSGCKIRCTSRDTFSVLRPGSLRFSPKVHTLISGLWHFMLPWDHLPMGSYLNVVAPSGDSLP